MRCTERIGSHAVGSVRFDRRGNRNQVETKRRISDGEKIDFLWTSTHTENNERRPQMRDPTRNYEDWGKGAQKWNRNQRRSMKICSKYTQTESSFYIPFIPIFFGSCSLFLQLLFVVFNRFDDRCCIDSFFPSDSSTSSLNVFGNLRASKWKTNRKKMFIYFKYRFCLAVWSGDRFAICRSSSIRFNPIRFDRLSSSQKRNKNSRDRNNFMRTRTLCHSPPGTQRKYAKSTWTKPTSCYVRVCKWIAMPSASEWVTHFLHVFFWLARKRVCVCANSYWLTVAGEIVVAIIHKYNFIYCCSFWCQSINMHEFDRSSKSQNVNSFSFHSFSPSSSLN